MADLRGSAQRSRFSSQKTREVSRQAAPDPKQTLLLLSSTTFFQFCAICLLERSLLLGRIVLTSTQLDGGLTASFLPFQNCFELFLNF